MTEDAKPIGPLVEIKLVMRSGVEAAFRAVDPDFPVPFMRYKYGRGQSALFVGNVAYMRNMLARARKMLDKLQAKMRADARQELDELEGHIRSGGRYPDRFQSGLDARVRDARDGKVRPPNVTKAKAAAPKAARASAPKVHARTKEAAVPKVDPVAPVTPVLPQQPVAAPVPIRATRPSPRPRQAWEKRVYRGFVNSRTVTTGGDDDKGRGPLDPHTETLDLGANAYSWGDGTRGAEQLAFAMLVDHFNNTQAARRYYRWFFNEVISKLEPKFGFTMRTADIDRAVRKIEGIIKEGPAVGVSRNGVPVIEVISDYTTQREGELPTHHTVATTVSVPVTALHLVGSLLAMPGYLSLEGLTGNVEEGTKLINQYVNALIQQHLEHVQRLESEDRNTKH